MGDVGCTPPREFADGRRRDGRDGRDGRVGAGAGLVAVVTIPASQILFSRAKRCHRPTLGVRGCCLRRRARDASYLTIVNFSDLGAELAVAPVAVRVTV
jgi:hypothetical protein